MTVSGIVKVLGLVTLVGGLVAQAAVGHYRIGELERTRDELKAEVKEMREERTKGAAEVPLIRSELTSLKEKVQDLNGKMDKVLLRLPPVRRDDR